MKVKKASEITMWLEDNGYAPDEYGNWDRIDGPIFGAIMWQYCEMKPNLDFVWSNEWLEEEQKPRVECCVTVGELKEVCKLTAKLVEIRQNKCKHLRIESIAPDIFHSLLSRLVMIKDGDLYLDATFLGQGVLGGDK